MCVKSTVSRISFTQFRTMTSGLPRVIVWLAVTLPFGICAFGQSSTGRLTGKVTGADGNPVAGVIVVATNQSSSAKETDRTNSEGIYSMRLRTGAYRISVERPYEARFDRGRAQEYGVFSIIICEASARNCAILENVIVGSGERKIDFIAVDPGKVATGPTPEPTPPTQAPSIDRREVRDRWRIEYPEYDRYGDRGAQGRDIPFRRGRWYNPYDQSVIKGDRPIIGGDIFMVLSAVSSTNIEIRRIPASTNVSSADPDNNNFFGRPENFFFNQTLQLSFEMFKGQTTFQPRTWAFKISPTFSIPNYLNARENGVVNIDVRRGTTRTDTHVSLEEAFAEVKLFNTNDNYDAVSIRAGIQPFNADFRGFLYSDNNLGIRTFGAFSNNKTQFNLVWFHQLDKDTNSKLNRFLFRHQNVYIANLYRQDFLKKGYTIQLLGAFNDDRGRKHFDTNGFPVRPALIGSARQHDVQAGYFGINGDGHIGILNLTHSYYFAFGRDEFNGIAGRKTDIRAHMAAAEFSIDRNWLRFKASGFFATGDEDPTDDKAEGFDAIFDDPNFAGGQFSYWNRQGFKLLSTDVGLVHANSLLPTLRSEKTEGQASFVNPGIFILNGGVDAEITPTVKAVFNANYLRFHRTQSLEYVLFEPEVRNEIGYDLSLGVVYRPFLINNITFTFGGNVLIPGKGFKDIYTDQARNCPVPNFCTTDVPNPSKPQYTLFSQMKLIF